MVAREIIIRGARTHNLKDLSCRIPQEALTVITGVSGSGKSSLAFDTLFAEGQRRYVESMSAYARQFLERIPKPDVDDIKHVLPAIALEQKNRVKNARSTVGTATEIYDFFRVLYATIGQTVCDSCGSHEVTQADPRMVQKHLTQLPEKTKLILMAPVKLEETTADMLIDRGFYRIFHHGDMSELTDLKASFGKQETIRVVIDRLIIRKNTKLSGRLLESVQETMKLSHGKLEIYYPDTGETQCFENQYACMDCGKAFTKPFANLFSFNSPLGACPTCEGFGRIIGLDLDKVIPNTSLSLQEGAVHPFTTPSNRELQDLLISTAKKSKISVVKPYEELKDSEKSFVIDGKGHYPGVRGFFDWLESKKYKVHVRVMLAKYRGYYDCPDCLGSRLRREALNVVVENQNILELCRMPVRDLLLFFEKLWNNLTEREQISVKRLYREITGRMMYLHRVGLGYLTLSRQTRTLSGGEAQRINLSSALGSLLTDTLYVLDEPTVGLHARDTQRLLEILKTLRDHGNTVVVVEHDPEMIMGADHVIDLGPSGGEEGGRIVYEGDISGLLETKYSKTAIFLTQTSNLVPNQATQKTKAQKNGKNGQKKLIPPPSSAASGWIEIMGARGNNLKNLTVRLPKSQLVCITGVSGSGKSTLIKQTLYAGYQRGRGQSLELDMGSYIELKGLENFEDIILVDQSPPGRSVRSNPVTYVKAYDEIRKLFAESRQAMVKGLTPGHFSFNTPGGRCEVCEGMGVITIDMQFMADVTVTCHECRGRRFTPAVLSIELFNRNIHDVLSMTVNEAAEFFKTASKIRKRLKPLQDIGLGYLKLGQATATLSGGEAQRLKLASYLHETKQNQLPRLFLFDEPTTGLHMSDIAVLVDVLRTLLAAGHSIIVIEHNLEFIARADYIVDLGPEGGDEGGEIVAQGSIADIMASPESLTGQFLKQSINLSAANTKIGRA
ncbi:MAG: excinuclease ABC subunit UvrA [Vampirovibrio sp.]|nr:excinuclease ABC subunit UvrA [Vampirovibrio sp.]